MKQSSNEDELREQMRQLIGRILERHGNEAITAWREQKGFTMAKWDMGTYVLKIEALIHQKQLEARLETLQKQWDWLHGITVHGFPCNVLNASSNNLRRQITETKAALEAERKEKS